MGNKKIFLIISLAIIAFMLGSGNVLAAAPSSFVIDDVSSPTQVAGISVSYKKSNGTAVYCLSYKKQTPTEGCSYTRTNYYFDDPAIAYILEYNITSSQSARWKYHVKEAALYRYLYDNRTKKIINSTNGKTYTPNQVGLSQYTGIASNVWTRVSNATNGLNKTILTNAKKASSSSSSSDASLKASTASKSTATCDTSSGTRMVVSPLITVKGNSVDLKNATITLSDSNASVINKTVSGNTLTFNIAYSADSLSSKKNVTATISATSTTTVNRYYIYQPSSGCGSNVQETVILNPEEVKTTLETTATVEIDPDVCKRYDYRPDSICLNCDASDEEWSYIYTDSANWEGIKDSILSSSSPQSQKYFSSGSINGNTVACREQIRVKLPNQTNAIQVHTGRYFTVGLPQQYSINVPNFEPLKVERTKECRAYDSSGNDVTSSVDWSTYWKSDTFYQNATSSDNSKQAESTGTITLDYTEQNGSSNYNGEKATDVYNTQIEPSAANSNTLTVTNSYTLTADTYRYIRKDNGLSVSTIPDVAYDDVGVANLPISFTNTDEDSDSTLAATLQFNYTIPSDSHLAEALQDSNYFKGDTLQDDDKDIYKVASSEGAISADSDTIQQGGLDSDQFNDLKHTACALQYCSDSDINGSSTSFSCSGFGSCVADKINSGKTQNDCSTSDNYICDINFGDDDDNVCRIEDGKYYINEEEVTKEEYESQCACKIENGKYYIDEEEVTEEEYYKVCPRDERVCPDWDPCCLGYCDTRLCPPVTDANDCDTDGDINVIYRTIDLNTPFPGYSAEKRVTGANWCYYNASNKSLECGSGTYTSQTANEVVNQVIYANRGVKGNPETVYQEDPIYSVTLDADKITAIQSYNDDHEYSDFTLSCEDDGTGCKLSSTVKSLLGVSGVCANARGDSFYTCDE